MFRNVHVCISKIGGQNMDEKKAELINVGSRKITQREKSGSLQVVIPSKLVEHMGLNEGEQLIFYMDPNDSGYTIALKSFIKEFPALGVTRSLQSLKGRKGDE